MKKIYKYELNIAGDMTVINAPIDQLLKVDWQSGTGAVLWAIVDDEREPATWRIMSLGTGWTVPEDVNDYIGTVQDDFGYVWHYFLLHNTVEKLEPSLQEEATTIAVLAQALGQVGISAEQATKAFNMEGLFDACM